MHSETPLHQLTNTQTRVWVLGGEDAKANLASNIALQYKSVVGVIAYRGQLIAWVAPNGNVKDLDPPYRRVFRNEVANAPDPGRCACAEFHDPETSRPWKERGSPEHHPMCEFDRTSHTVFNKYVSKVKQVGLRNLRPDEHLRERERARGQRGEKSGPRSL